jgi:hypothetical protein
VIVPAGAALYLAALAALAFALFYDFRKTRSVMLALSTSMLQQFAVLGLVVLFASWKSEQAQRR